MSRNEIMTSLFLNYNGILVMAFEQMNQFMDNDELQAMNRFFN